MKVRLVINGYGIFAHRENTGGGYVILGERTRHDGSHEYVTALVHTMEDREWYWGHYSGAQFGSTLREATEDFYAR
jgi:hypothetical protein